MFAKRPSVGDGVHGSAVQRRVAVLEVRRACPAPEGSAVLLLLLLLLLLLPVLLLLRLLLLRLLLLLFDAAAAV
jgi:hypothetical protein